MSKFDCVKVAAKGEGIFEEALIYGEKLPANGMLMGSLVREEKERQYEYEKL